MLKKALILLITLINLSACSAPEEEPPNARCGNGQLEDGEQCDGDNLNESSCQTQGYASGELRCSSSCHYETSSCVEQTPVTCGNGVKEAGEACDGQDIGDAAACPGGDAPTCDASCELSCPAQSLCGNGVLDRGEPCDGELFGEAMCPDNSSISCKQCQLDCTPIVAPPELSAPSHLSFGLVPVNTSLSRVILVENVGGGELELGVPMLAANAPEFTISYPDPSQPNDPSKDLQTWTARLLSGEQALLRITFTPTSINPITSDLTIASNDSNVAAHVIRLSGNTTPPCISLRGVEEVPNSTEETHLLDFGLSSIGKIKSKKLLISNCSLVQPLTIDALKLADAALSAFSISTDVAAQLVIAPREAFELTLTYTPSAEREDLGELTFYSDDSSLAQAKVKLMGEGTSKQCPIASAKGQVRNNPSPPSDLINTPPQKLIELTGADSSSALPISRYQWSIIKKPMNSLARPSSPDTKESDIFIDIAGEYIIELSVYDIQDFPSCEPARITINALYSEDIAVEMVWQSNADLDLHYKRRTITSTTQWDSYAHDIFWRNPTADWGVLGDPDDDPKLLLDSSEVETVVHDNPSSQELYDIGAYYFDDQGLGATYATANIYIDGVLSNQFRDVYIEKSGDFWHVGLIDGQTKMFTTINTNSAGFPN